MIFAEALFYRRVFWLIPSRPRVHEGSLLPRRPVIAAHAASLRAVHRRRLEGRRQATPAFGGTEARSLFAKFCSTCGRAAPSLSIYESFPINN
jgi:hypothetical protein